MDNKLWHMETSAPLAIDWFLADKSCIEYGLVLKYL